MPSGKEDGQVVRGMRPARIMAPIFSNNTPREIAFTKAALAAGVFGLMLENLAWIRSYPHLSPPLYKAGVIYKPEKRRVASNGHVVEYGEDWQTIPYVIFNGYGDCEDLGAYRSAELRAKGILATPDIAIRQLPDGAWRAHVRVRHPDGSIEDPSAKLGMYSYANLTTGREIDRMAREVRANVRTAEGLNPNPYA
jgi:hypothetical protein